MRNPTWYNQVNRCCNIAVQSCNFIIPWQHVLSCMNMAIGLSRWLQQRCSNLSVQICPFIKPCTQSVPTCMNKPVNNLVSKNKLCVFAWVEALHLNLERNSAKYLQYSDTSYIGWRYSVSGLKRFEFSLKMKLPFMTQTFSFTLQPPGRSWRHWPRHYFPAVKFYCSETIRY